MGTKRGGSKKRGIRRTKMCKQKTEYRRHQRNRLEKLARRGVPTTTPLNR